MYHESRSKCFYVSPISERLPVFLPQMFYLFINLMVFSHYPAGLHNLRNVHFTTLENVSETDPFTHAPFTPPPNSVAPPNPWMIEGPREHRSLSWAGQHVSEYVYYECECVCMCMHVCV